MKNLNGNSSILVDSENEDSDTDSNFIDGFEDEDEWWNVYIIGHNYHGLYCHGHKFSRT